MRQMVQETRLSAKQLVYPVFVKEGKGKREEISAMPGQFRYTPDTLVEELQHVHDLGVPAVMLFGIPEEGEKDPSGKAAWASDGVICRSLEAAKKSVPELILIADVCLCEYTDHGHCGLIRRSPAGEVRIGNDETLKVLARTALAYARAGADIVAPSDMMDGRVETIREALDKDDLEYVPILSYAAKYASAFYGPFREAAGSAPRFGDRRGYQMDPPNVREAMLEIGLDLEQGADIVMVKPALAYLDVLRAARERFDAPLAAYNVSGEYAMIKAAAQRGWIDEIRVRDEVLVSIKRAGADMILTYFAKDVARTL